MRRIINVLRRIEEIARPPNRAEADWVLQNAGYRRLGNGSFGAVYQKPGNPYVLKVFTPADKAYLDFLALARAHADNPHFPRFFGKIVPVTPAYSAIRMERLEPYTDDPLLIADYFDLRDWSPDNNYGAMRRGEAIEYMESHPQLREACDLIMDHLTPKYRIDIKPDNLMLRGKTVVLTDPVADLDVKKLASEKLPPRRPWPEDEAKPQDEPKPQWTDADEELYQQLLGDH